MPYTNYYMIKDVNGNTPAYWYENGDDAESYDEDIVNIYKFIGNVCSNNIIYIIAPFVDRKYIHIPYSADNKHVKWLVCYTTGYHDCLFCEWDFKQHNPIFDE